jgi:hypothetical protein
MPLSDLHDLTGRIDRDLSRRLASKYIWWKTADEALATPVHRGAGNDMGDYADVQALAVQAGDDAVMAEVKR